MAHAQNSGMKSEGGGRMRGRVSNEGAGNCCIRSCGVATHINQRMWISRCFCSAQH